MSETISVETKRAAVIKAFGPIPHLDDLHYLNFMYERRHSKSHDLRYGIERFSSERKDNEKQSGRARRPNNRAVH